MSSHHGATDKRTASFSRNTALESLLKDINASLWLAEQALLQEQPEAAYPLILVMGPHRSGTTLFMQWLANSGLVAYPTNLLSRFYQAPVIGAKIQLLLTDPRFNFRDELGEFSQQADYTSENGKTKGALAPNEFWYFWRRFLAEPARDVWTDSELAKSMDTKTMLAELAGLTHVFQKPFAAKGMLFNYNIPFLDSVLDKVIFVQLRRDEDSHVRSALAARRRQFGNKHEWYSFCIPEQAELMLLDPESQVRGQLRAINAAVTRGMASVSDDRKMIIDLEKFCASPAEAYDSLAQRLAWPRPYAGPTSFLAK